MQIEIDRGFLLETLGGLVRINSVNPGLVAGAPGEKKIADYTASRVEDGGGQVRLHEPQPGRVSVVGVWHGTGGGRSLMLNAHYDTVGVDGMASPFSAEVREGRLYGRGAYDMKGSLAACLAAAKALHDSGIRLKGDLIVAAVADEEYAGAGTADLIGRYRVDAAIVTEPTQLMICRAHKGFIWLEVETLGRAYHGSQFEHGIDANMRMGRFLARLDHLEKQLRLRGGHPLVGPPSLHAAMIQGGAGLSVYSPSCSLKIERRTIPGETEEQVRREIQPILDQLRQDDPTFRAEMKTLMVREPFEVAADADIVTALEGGCRQVMGIVPQHVGENPWMDSALLSSAGIETVVFGPSGAGAHSDEEWVDLASVQTLAEVLAATAAAYCG